MNPKELKQFRELLQDPEIKKRVYEKVPLSKDEKTGCVTEKAFRDNMRWDFMKQNYQIGKEKKEYGK